MRSQKRARPKLSPLRGSRVSPGLRRRRHRRKGTPAWRPSVEHSRFFSTLCTQTIRDGTPFLLLIETPPTFERSFFHTSRTNVLRILSPSCFAVCGHNLSPRLASWLQTSIYSLCKLYYIFHPVDSSIFHPVDSSRRRYIACLLYTSPSPRDGLLSRMPSSA